MGISSVAAQDASSSRYERLFHRSADKRWQDIRSEKPLTSRPDGSLSKPMARPSVPQQGPAERNREDLARPFPELSQPDAADHRIGREPTTTYQSPWRAEESPARNGFSGPSMRAVPHEESASGWDEHLDRLWDNHEQALQEGPSSELRVDPSRAGEIVTIETFFGPRSQQTIAQSESVLPEVTQDANVQSDPLPSLPDQTSPSAPASTTGHIVYDPVRLTDILPYDDYHPNRKTTQEKDALYAELQKRSVPLPVGGNPERYFAHWNYFWQPTNLFHEPLYFQDVSLERYGHTHGPLLQPFVSTGRFGAQVLALPYQMALDHPHRRVSTLGWFRPGDPAPYLHKRIPFNAKAAALSGAVYTGLIFAFP